jgi:NAD(P)-dependent dehydrogenase (short-subunit alcohol dehydrogenase family)
MRLAGKVALITGGASGMGRSEATILAREGARVVVADLLDAEGAQTVDTIKAAGGQARFVKLDVSSEAEWRAAVEATVAAFGALDILVNNAAVNHRGPVLTQPPERLAEIITTNLVSPIYLTRVALPLMRAGGVVVNVASLAGMVPVPEEATYSASKAGLRAFTRALGVELESRGIRCSSVCPGPVDTGFLGEDPDHVPPIVFSQPMSSPAAVADAVLACITDGVAEVAIPRVSGALASVGYLFPSLVRTLRPLLDRRGAAAKARYFATRRRPAR